MLAGGSGVTLIDNDDICDQNLRTNSSRISTKHINLMGSMDYQVGDVEKFWNVEEIAIKLHLSHGQSEMLNKLLNSVVRI